MRLVCVTGMHRSGTSVVARIVNLLGVALGPESDLMSATPDNPKGYWEHDELSSISDEILYEVFGGRWHRPPVLADGWEHDRALDPYRRRVAEVFRESLPNDAELAGWKDPRVSLLLPFFRTVRPVDRVILTVRDPAAVAGSLLARDGHDPAHACDLWTRYTVSALRDAPERHIVLHQDIFDDLGGTVDALADYLDIDRPDERTRERIEEFVDPDLRRSSSFQPPASGEYRLARSLFELISSGRVHDVGAVAGSLHRLLVDVERATRAAEQAEAERDRRIREVNSYDARLQEARARAERVPHLEQQWLEARRTAAEADARAEVLRNELTRVRERIEEFESRRRETDARIRETQREKARLERQLEDARNSVTRARHDLSRLRKRRSVRFALSLARPFKPIFRAVRTFKKWRRSPSGRAGDADTNGQRSTRTEERPGRASEAQQRSMEERLLGSLPAVERTSGPPVSIVILNRSGEHHLRRCMPALVDTEYDPLEVVVVDNASEDGSVEYLRSLDPPFPLRIIENDRNRSFSEANNQGVAAASGELLLLLNNDIVPIGSKWLGRMVDTLLDRDAGVVGARLIYPARPDLDNQGDLTFPDLTLQHRGVDFVSSGGVPKGRNLGTGSDPLGPMATATRDVPAVTAACMLVRRDVFEAVGGLTEGYQYGTEDVDLCLKLREAGTRIVYDGQVVAWHHEYGTQNVEGRERKRQNRIANRELFLDTWGPTLFREFLLDKLRGSGELTDEPLHVAITLTHDDPAAGWGDYYTAHELGEAFEALGYRVTYAERYKERWYELDPSVDVLVVLLDLMDIHRIPEHIVTVAWVRNWTDRWLEHPWFDDFDVVFASSEKSRRLIRERSSRVALPLPLATNPDRFRPREPSEDLRCDVVFVGNYWEKPRDIIEALPYLPDDLDVRVYGNGWEKLPHIRPYHRGVLPYERLADAYNSARIVIDDTAGPTKPYGAVNSRVFDALATGAVVVSDNPVGVQEVFDADFPTWDDGPSLAKVVERNLDAAQEASDRAERYRADVISHHTYRRRVKQIRDALIEWCGRTRIGLCIGVPDREEAPSWGDTHFARGLQRYLERAGIPTRVHLLPSWEEDHVARDDVVVHLFGLSELRTRPAQVNVLWNISHPERVNAELCDRYDLILTASDRFAEELRELTDLPVVALHQATDPERFWPDRTGPAHELLVVANTRKTKRRVIEDLLPTRHELAIYGKGWDEHPAAHRHVRGEHIPNEDLHRYYASARIVLNDHWDAMREKGFISNRLYDALASGAFVITDHVDGLEEEFDSGLVSYETPDELRDLVDRFLEDDDGRRRIAERGRQAVLDRHNFEQRVATILGLVHEPVAAHRRQLKYPEPPPAQGSLAGTPQRSVG